jgi:hypothetical protein
MHPWPGGAVTAPDGRRPGRGCVQVNSNRVRAAAHCGWHPREGSAGRAWWTDGARKKKLDLPPHSYIAVGLKPQSSQRIAEPRSVTAHNDVRHQAAPKFDTGRSLFLPVPCRAGPRQPRYKLRKPTATAAAQKGLPGAARHATTCTWPSDTAPPQRALAAGIPASRCDVRHLLCSSTSASTRFAPPLVTSRACRRLLPSARARGRSESPPPRPPLVSAGFRTSSFLLTPSSLLQPTTPPAPRARK